MTWEHLLFINIPVSVNRIQAQLPEGLRVDAWNGFAYVSLVPMRLKNFTVKKISWIFNPHFYEFNLRTYVLVNNRPGIYFFSLDASSLPEVLGARGLFNLNYRFRNMQLSLQEKRFSFTMRSALLKANTQICAEITDEPLNTNPLIEFCTQRDTYYVVKRGHIYKGKVQHPPWKFYKARITQLQTQVFSPLHPADPVVFSYGTNVFAQFLKPAVQPIVFFDGQCGLCNRAIRWLMVLDRKQQLRFAPLNGSTFKAAEPPAHLPDRIVFKDDQGFKDGVNALLAVLDYLPWYIRGLKIFKALPQAFLEGIYDRIARNRNLCRPYLGKQSDFRILD